MTDPSQSLVHNTLFDYLFGDKWPHLLSNLLADALKIWLYSGVLITNYARTVAVMIPKSECECGLETSYFAQRIDHPHRVSKEAHFVDFTGLMC